MKFKKGEKVKVIKCVVGNSNHEGEIGVITRRGCSSKDCHYHVKVKGYGECCAKQVRGTRGRPKKEKPVKYIAIYDENDADPVKEFTSKKELKVWLLEAQENEDIDFDSIKAYPVGPRLKIEFKKSVIVK